MKKLLLLVAVSFLNFNSSAQNDPSLTVGDTGTITFNYQGNLVTYTTVRGADGMIWLQQNLGSSQIASYATDSLAYGHYFQWGRWDDGHQIPISTQAPSVLLNPNNPSAIPTGSLSFFTGDVSNYWWVGGSGSDTWSNSVASANNGVDPCAAVGPNWHMPDQPQFANLITLENIIDTLTAFNSNLKFTLSGYRDFQFGYLEHVDTSGNYWTSSASNSLGSHISISAFDGIDVVYPTFRGYGMSVRCLTTCTGVYAPDTIIGPDTVCAGSVNTWSVQGFTYTNNYMWSIPVGASIIGPANGSSINVMMGNNNGVITARSAGLCDTSVAVTMNVTVNPLPQPVIVQSGWLLSTGSYSSYQWLLNNNIITGATSNPYTASGGGTYRVIVTDANGCSDTSATVTLSVENSTLTEKLEVYPNPATTQLFINSSIPVDAFIYSMEGRLVLQQNGAAIVDISALTPGTYQLKLIDKGRNLLKVEKLIVLPH